MSQPDTRSRSARHEFRLAWRDWWSMMTAGKPHASGSSRWRSCRSRCSCIWLPISIVGKFAEVEPEPTEAPWS